MIPTVNYPLEQKEFQKRLREAQKAPEKVSVEIHHAADQGDSDSDWLTDGIEPAKEGDQAETEKTEQDQ